MKAYMSAYNKSAYKPYLHHPPRESGCCDVQQEHEITPHDALRDAPLREAAAPEHRVEHRGQTEAQRRRQEHREGHQTRNTQERSIRGHLEWK